jgi:SAM-dependent methyltransferase
MIKNKIRRILRPHDKLSFLSKLHPNAEILDVGCGNNSPLLVKNILPNAKYTGIDIGDYNQEYKEYADSYIITTPEKFPNTIFQFNNAFDAVISAHNLEHCNDREATLNAMLGAVKPGGLIFITFPCDKSISFPHRNGTLNYFDDKTHKADPPDYSWVLKIIEKNQFEITYTIQYSKPWFDWVRAALNEYASKIFNFEPKENWAFYGFETIIWAKKINKFIS